MADKPFLTDIKTLRERARKHIENGAVTEGYKADRETVVKLLNEALATEIVCVLRYKRHYFMASGIHAEGVAAEFLQHANEEQDVPEREPAAAPAPAANPVVAAKPPAPPPSAAIPQVPKPPSVKFPKSISRRSAPPPRES